MFALQTIRSIRPAGTVETWDIQVEGTHNFIADGVVVHNCESGSGIVPRQGIEAASWLICMIPAGERGDVSHTQFSTTQADGTLQSADFAIAVFDRPVTANQMANVTPYQQNANLQFDPSTGVVGPGDPVLDTNGTPMIGDPRAEGFWDFVPTDLGLIIGWGGVGQMGGFYPFTQGNVAPTGQFVDDGSWWYQSTQPPWLWVAMWVEPPADGSWSTCFIQGQFFPSSTSE